MQDEFDFNEITSVEFCVSVREGEDYTDYLVPSAQNVQNALKEMLRNTTHQLEASDDEWQTFELSEKYAAREALIADLASEEMATISSLYDEEGWTPNPRALDTPASIPYYFAVFRDATERKLLGVRQAAQFKGVISKRLIRLLDDSLTMIEDRVFKLDNDFDFLVTAQHVYILRPAGFERIAQVEKFASAKAREKTLALGGQVTFVDFEALADFVAGHKRAARLVAALSARAGLNEIQKSRFRLAAADTGVTLQNVGRKIRPAPGSEMPFLELLDDRRYTTAIKTGPKEAYVASSRKPISRPT